MKVSDLRNSFQHLIKGSDELSKLDLALARLDDMPIIELAKKLINIPAPMLALDKVAKDLKLCVGDTSLFDGKLTEVVSVSSFKKTMIVELYDLVFESSTKLKPSMTKNQMIEKFKAQHRRELNFRAA